MAEYIRLSEGLHNYKLIPANDDLWNHIKTNDKDYYTSIFRYNEEHYKQWKTKKTVSGIQDVTTNKLVFDFDDANNPENARQDVIELVSRLMNNGIKSDNIQVAFSGNKGFSVEVHTTERFTPEEFKNVTFALAKDLKTFDTVVNDAQRLIRVIGTKHNKSNLYKFPLTVSQVTDLNIDTIRSMASDVDNIDTDVMAGWHEIELPETVKSMRVSKVKEKPKVEKMEHNLDLSLKPKWLSDAKFALQQGFFEEGERNTACMILASTYKNQGFPKEIVYRIIKGTLELRANRLGLDGYDKGELWKTIIEPIYGEHWKGGTYSYENTPLLQEVTARLGLKVPKVEEDPLAPVTKISDVFKRFATEIESNTIKLGIKKIDDNVRITTSMLVGLVSPAGGGKTTTSFEIMHHASKNNIKTVFFSMDMGAPLVYQRLIQKHTRLHSKEIFKMYETNSPEVEKFDKKLEEAYKNVSFCFKSGLTVEEIRELTLRQQEETGEKIKLVVIDYLECISSQFSDATASSAYITQKLKDLANELECTVLLLLQPQKIAGDPSDEINSYTRIKGSSVIQQACSVIFSMNRPGFSPKDPGDDRFISFFVLKNRMGSLGQYDFHWNGLTGDIRELDENEVEELKQIRARRQAEKSSDGGL